jgi:hypothetical protein
MASRNENAEQKPPHRAVHAGRVQRVADLPPRAVTDLLARFGMRAVRVASGAPIPGSYWGECEAGLEGDTLHYRDDTPVHSILHEACHYACMTPARRAGLDTDAGGDDPEECAVCYLQILVAAAEPAIGAGRMLLDMDAWGYSFRLGSARRWFEEDANDARTWLERHGLVDAAGRPAWRLRGAGAGGDT